MCAVCGCAHGEVRIEPAETAAGGPAQGHHHHGHDHHHNHEHEPGPAALAQSTVGALRDDPSERAELVSVEKRILSKNDAIAARNRRHFAAHDVLALNLVSSPGAGKTTLLVALIDRLARAGAVAVIEGDQETSADADRIRATGAPAIQVNTGKGCHLDAAMVEKAFDALHISSGVLVIENVGNLVCPAGFDLGEDHKIVIASVTEGDDKPLKYPAMFAAATLMVVSKIDLLPHLDADVDALIANARKVNPAIQAIRVSAKTGEGLEKLADWIAAARAMRRAAE